MLAFLPRFHCEDAINCIAGLQKSTLVVARYGEGTLRQEACTLESNTPWGHLPKLSRPMLVGWQSANRRVQAACLNSDSRAEKTTQAVSLREAGRRPVQSSNGSRVVLLEPSIERCLADFLNLGRFSSIAIGCLQDPLYMVPFNLSKGTIW